WGVAMKSRRVLLVTLAIVFGSLPAVAHAGEVQRSATPVRVVSCAALTAKARSGPWACMPATQNPVAVRRALEHGAAAPARADAPDGYCSSNPCRENSSTAFYTTASVFYGPTPSVQEGIVFVRGVFAFNGRSAGIKEQYVSTSSGPAIRGE